MVAGHTMVGEGNNTGLGCTLTHACRHTHTCILSSSNIQARLLRTCQRAKQQQSLSCQDAASNPSPPLTGNTTIQVLLTSCLEQGFLMFLEPGAPSTSRDPVLGTKSLQYRVLRTTLSGTPLYVPFIQTRIP